MLRLIHKKVIYAYLLLYVKFYNLHLYICEEFKTDL